MVEYRLRRNVESWMTVRHLERALDCLRGKRYEDMTPTEKVLVNNWDLIEERGDQDDADNKMFEESCGR